MLYAKVRVTELGKLVPIRTEVVLDDVQDDRYSAGMRRIHESSEVIGVPVAMGRRIQQDPVVAPIALSRETAIGMISIAVMPSSARWSSLSMAARKVPSGVQVPICTS